MRCQPSLETSVCDQSIVQCMAIGGCIQLLAYVYIYMQANGHCNSRQGSIQLGGTRWGAGGKLPPKNV